MYSNFGNRISHTMDVAVLILLWDDAIGEGLNVIYSLQLWLNSKADYVL